LINTAKRPPTNLNKNLIIKIELNTDARCPDD
jgi:hypothetical protein